MYYFTENIMWLSKEHIGEKDLTMIADVPDLPELVGSGQSVGGVVSPVVGATTEDAMDLDDIQVCI